MSSFDPSIANALTREVPLRSEFQPAWSDVVSRAERRSRHARRKWRSLLVAAVVAVAALVAAPIGGASLGTRVINGISTLWETPANQSNLDAAADAARATAGSSYYTGAVVDDAANKVDVYLADAPQSLINQLQALHPGVYVIHNDAAHPLTELLKLENSLDLPALKSQGIDVVSVHPGNDGYLQVGVSSSVEAAQQALDAKDPGIAHVYSAQSATITPHLVGG